MLTKDQFYELAKIIDGYFIGKYESFRATNRNGLYYFLSTNKCDLASDIRVYFDHHHIIKITRCAEDTDGHEELQVFTINKIKEYLETIKIKDTL